MPETSSTPSFQDQLAAAANAANIIQEFEGLILKRFAALTRQGKVHDRRGRTPEPITDIDAHSRTDGGYGSWALPPWWNRSLNTVDVDTQTLTFVHHIAGDHAISATDTDYEVPWALLAVDPESDESYKEFLRLKAIFEPGA